MAPDFRDLTQKPLWITELGALNYSDPTGAEHGGLAGNNDLYNTRINSPSFRDMTRKLIAGGAQLVMPWSIADNAGIVAHNADGSHTLGDLMKWTRNQLASRQTRG